MVTPFTVAKFEERYGHDLEKLYFEILEKGYMFLADASNYETLFDLDQGHNYKSPMRIEANLSPVS